MTTTIHPYKILNTAILSSVDAGRDRLVAEGFVLSFVQNAAGQSFQVYTRNDNKAFAVNCGFKSKKSADLVWTISEIEVAA